MDPRNPEPQESQLPPLIAQLPPQTILPYIPQNLITSGTKRDCIRLRNLPGGAQVTDILSFLAEFSQFIIYQGVHMVYSAQVSTSTLFCKLYEIHVYKNQVAWKTVNNKTLYVGILMVGTYRLYFVLGYTLSIRFISALCEFNKNVFICFFSLGYRYK